MIDCIPKYPTHIDKNEKMSVFSVFCLVFLFTNTSNLQYQQGLDEFKEKKMEIGIKEHLSGFAWVMGNMGGPGIIDLLYPGLESHAIFKSVGHKKHGK